MTIVRRRGSHSFKGMLCLVCICGCGGSPPPVTPPVRAEAVPNLIRDLKLKDATSRARAAVAIGEIGPEAKEAVPALAAVLSDRDPSVRAAAAYSLGQIGPDAKAAIPELEALSRQSGSIREVAAKSIKQIKP